MEFSEHLISFFLLGLQMMACLFEHQFQHLQKHNNHRYKSTPLSIHQTITTLLKSLIDQQTGPKYYQIFHRPWIMVKWACKMVKQVTIIPIKTSPPVIYAIPKLKKWSMTEKMTMNPGPSQCPWFIGSIPEPIGKHLTSLDSTRTHLYVSLQH